MPLLPRAHHLQALALACVASVTVGTGSAAAHPAPHAHHHVAKPHRHVVHAHKAVHSAKSSKTTAPVKTTAPTTPVAPTTSTTAAPTTTVAPTPTVTSTPTPVAPTSTTTTTPTTATTASSTSSTTATSSTSQLLFQNAYPASGTALNLLGTGWTAAQYPSVNGVAQPSRIQFGPAPGSPSDPNLPTTSVARFELDPYYTAPGLAAGDVTDTGGYLANRVEVYGRYGGPALPADQWPDPVGSVRWYSFSVYIPADFPTSTSSSQWFDFTQWKGLNTGSPPVAMEIRGTNFYLGGSNSSQNLGSIDPGTWTHFVVGMDFSTSSSTGWASVYKNGSLLIDQYPTQTMNTWTVAGVTGADPNYLKMGIYRSKTWNVTQVIDLTPMTIGTTLASVS